MSRHVLTIEKLVASGFGLARLESGKVAFVKGALPGEKVVATLSPGPGKTFKGEVEEVIHQSPHRIIPDCAKSHWCGGCDWLFIDMEHALALKAEILKESMKRAGVPAGLPTVGLHKSPVGRQARARARLHISPKGGLGFLARGSNDVVELDCCAGLRPGLSKVLPRLSEIISHTLPRAGKQVLAALDDQGIIACTLLDARGRYIEPSRDVQAYEALASAGLEVPGKEPVHLVFKAPLCDQRVRADSFFQANPEANYELVSTILERVPHDAGTCLDLYCGSGNIALNLASAGLKVEGLDADPNAIGTAETNALSLGVAARFHVSDLDQEDLPDLRRFDMVVLDPPRKGAKNVAARLSKTGPGTVFHLGCDPATFARDAALLWNAGYEPASIDVFDFFPGTHHFEILAHWTR